jgi:hypothetical protein
VAARTPSAPAGKTRDGPSQRFGRALLYSALGLAVVAILNAWADSPLLTFLTLALAAVVVAFAVAPSLVRGVRSLISVCTPFGRWIRERALWVLGLASRLDRRFGSPVGRLVDRLRSRPANELRLLRGVTRLGIVALTLLAVAGAVIVVTDALGWLLRGRSTPLAVEWLYVGAAVSGAALVLVIAFVGWSLGVVVFRQHWPRGTVSVGIVGLLLAALFLSARPVPGQEDFADKEGTRRAGSIHDVLVVVDPADAAGRELARFAAANLWTASRVRSDTVPYDVAFAVATPAGDAPAGRREAWLFLEPPTSVRRHFLESMAQIAPADPPPATGAYSSLFSDLRASMDFKWRLGARRTIALVVRELPSEAALDRRDVPGGDEVPTWRALVSMAGDDRTAEPPPERYARVVVLTQDRRLGRVALWRDYLEQMGGTLIHYDVFDATVLRDLEDAATGAPASAVRALAQRFSPHLQFDSEEKFLPVDVDQLLAKRATDGGHQVCRHGTLEDSCDPVSSYRDLLDAYDEYIDFEGGARLGRDLYDRDNRLRLRRRVYVQAIEDAERSRLHLVYWWFMRYNVSPVEPERNCLPGFTLAETTCFDHEGDWEGVTVTLAPDGDLDPLAPYALDSWRPESASFASHSQVTRWDWSALDLEGPIRSSTSHSGATRRTPCAARRTSATSDSPTRGCPRDASMDGSTGGTTRPRAASRCPSRLRAAARCGTRSADAGARRSAPSSSRSAVRATDRSHRACSGASRIRRAPRSPPRTGCWPSTSRGTATRRPRRSGARRRARSESGWLADSVATRQVYGGIG